jgi:YD repeat-containing protein
MTQNGAALVSNVQYGAASQMLQMTYSGITETRQYNNMFQLTQLTAGSVNMQYNYTAGSNNGKISSQSDLVSGEGVTYAYDSLNRLLSATSSVSAQSQSFAYDGFGNMTAKGALSVNVDPATNRVSAFGLSYDANGNMTFQPGMTGSYVYDAENRMTSAPGVEYGYDGQNKRNYKSGTGGEEFYFYGADGKKIGTYYLQAIPVVSNYNLTLTFTLTNPATATNGPPPIVYFRGRVLAPQDRLGSFGKYYPYGKTKGRGILRMTI